MGCCKTLWLYIKYKYISDVWPLDQNSKKKFEASQIGNILFDGVTKYPRNANLQHVLLQLDAESFTEVKYMEINIFYQNLIQI